MISQRELNAISVFGGVLGMLLWLLYYYDIKDALLFLFIFMIAWPVAKQLFARGQS